MTPDDWTPEQLRDEVRRLRAHNAELAKACFRQFEATRAVWALNEQLLAAAVVDAATAGAR